MIILPNCFEDLSIWNFKHILVACEFPPSDFRFLEYSIGSLLIATTFGAVS